MPYAHDDVDAACRALGAALGEAGCLRYCVPAAHGGALAELDSRALCLLRETLAYHDGLADFAFAMQGLGHRRDHARRERPAQQARWLPRVARGEAIAAFALSEPDAGSDVGAHRDARRARDGGAGGSTARRRGFSNGGIADFYCVFARTGAAPGARGISRVRRAGGRAGPRDRRALRRDRAAPARAPRVRRVPRAGRRAARRARARASSSRCARSTSSVPRSLRPRSALRGARSTRRSRTRARRTMFGGTLADLQLTQARARRHGRRQIEAARAAHLPRRVAARQCAHAARDDARGGDGEARRDRGRAAA